MQREKATSPFCLVDVAAVVEEATLATLGEPPAQPAASSEDAATATTEARMSGRRQHMIFGSFQSRARESSPPQPERIAALSERLLRASLEAAVLRIEA
jgi:hypothetical protein